MPATPSGPRSSDCDVPLGTHGDLARTVSLGPVTNRDRSLREVAPCTTAPAGPPLVRPARRRARAAGAAPPRRSAASPQRPPRPRCAAQHRRGRASCSRSRSSPARVRDVVRWRSTRSPRRRGRPVRRRVLAGRDGPRRRPAPRRRRRAARPARGAEAPDPRRPPHRRPTPPRRPEPRPRRPPSPRRPRPPRSRRPRPRPQPPRRAPRRPRRPGCRRRRRPTPSAEGQVLALVNAERAAAGCGAAGRATTGSPRWPGRTAPTCATAATSTTSTSTGSTRSTARSAAGVSARAENIAYGQAGRRRGDGRLDEQLRPPGEHPELQPDPLGRRRGRGRRRPLVDPALRLSPTRGPRPLRVGERRGSERRIRALIPRRRGRRAAPAPETAPSGSRMSAAVTMQHRPAGRDQPVEPPAVLGRAVRLGRATRRRTRSRASMLRIGEVHPRDEVPSSSRTGTARTGAAARRSARSTRSRVSGGDSGQRVRQCDGAAAPDCCPGIAGSSGRRVRTSPSRPRRPPRARRAADDGVVHRLRPGDVERGPHAAGPANPAAMRHVAGEAIRRTRPRTGRRPERTSGGTDTSTGVPGRRVRRPEQVRPPSAR